MSDDHEHEHAEREHEHDEPEHEHHELEHDAGGSAAPDSEAAGPGAFGLEESERFPVPQLVRWFSRHLG